MSNGLAWSLDKKKLYFIDSLKYKVLSYDYDDTKGSISNEKTVFCFKSNNVAGLPDGMTIDDDGMLWVACFTGAQVVRIDPNTGELKFTLKIPSYQVTSVCFGGQNLEDLYVTLAKMNYTGEEDTSSNKGLNFTKALGEKYPLAGKTFNVTGLGVKGTLSMAVQL